MKLLKILPIHIIILFSSSILFAQKGKIKKAERSYNAFAYSKAINIYEGITDKDIKNTDQLKGIANSYYFNADLTNAKKWYDKLFDKESNIEPEYYFRYAHALKSVGNYEKADQIMTMFYKLTNSSDKRGQLFDKMPNYLEYIKTQSGRYEIENLDINSNDSDFAPSFYGNKLIFSSDREATMASKNKKYDRFFLDLFVSDMSGDNSLNKTTKFSNIINTEFHESTSTFTSDGNTVYFTRNNFSNNKLKKDSGGTIKLKIYKAGKNSKGEWTTAYELPFNNDEYSVAHPTLNLEENKLYFSSDMPGGFGLSDIYEVDINPDGTFGVPKNLGEEINTEGRETFPFISKTGMLYFSSNGRPGLGGLDVFVTELTPNLSKEDIYNIGEPINSPYDDFSFIIDDETKKGYFASNRPEGKGKDDIYGLSEITPLIKNNGNEEIDKIDNEDENVVVTTLKEENKDPVKTARIDIAEFIKGDDLAKKLALKPIYFDTDKSFIRSDAAIELDKVVDVMNANPTMKIKIKSHTDSRAIWYYNTSLSKMRAKSSRLYLIKKGINGNRIKSEGYGESELLNRCKDGVRCSEEEHETNRRSEFIILEK